ncbi:hypothetical protein AAE478_005813 [Parahypoxylon ruwenzoriense]
MEKCCDSRGRDITGHETIQQHGDARSSASLANAAAREKVFEPHQTTDHLAFPRPCCSQRDKASNSCKQFLEHKKSIGNTQCESCCAKFGSGAVFRSHRASHHLPREDGWEDFAARDARIHRRIIDVSFWSCERCALVFETDVELDDHYFSPGTWAPGMQHHICPSCDVDFEDEESLEQHQHLSFDCRCYLNHNREVLGAGGNQEPEGMERNYCCRCHAMFPTMDDLVTHKDTCKDYICLLCQCVLKCDPGLELHLDEHHDCCKLCNEVFDTSDGLSIHRRDNSNTHYCPDCEVEDLYSVWLVRIHRILEHHSCIICNVSFSSHRELEAHIRGGAVGDERSQQPCGPKCQLNVLSLGEIYRQFNDDVRWNDFHS